MTATAAAAVKPPSASPAKPLLLAPAGDADCARAAVENGADAIYFGAGAFNARARAGAFTGGELPALLDWLHGRGARGYAAVNTLVFTDELAEVAATIRALAAAGADALIVQDAGVCRLVRDISPDLPIHASTQMTVTSGAGVEFARSLGASLVVLARECPVGEIRAIHAAATRPGAPPVTLEVFIHGALCVAYSGQCLTSEALGGRSANRGECAQACRLPYELVCDGKTVPLGARKYLLSPGDLAGMEMLPDLIRAGVGSFKIEGRLKAPEYVAAVTAAYRAALDAVWDALQRDDHAAAQAAAAAARARFNYDLEMSFSRGLGTGWLRGVDNRALVHARFGKKRGIHLGEITAVRDGMVRLQPARTGTAPDAPAVPAVVPRGTGGSPVETPPVSPPPSDAHRVLECGTSVPLCAKTSVSRPDARLNAAPPRTERPACAPPPPPLKPGDGVVFDAGDPEQREEGGFIHAVSAPDARGGLWLRFARESLDWRRVRPGQQLWKTADPALTRRLRATFAEGAPPRHRQPVAARVSGAAGQPLEVVFTTPHGHAATARSQLPLSIATPSLSADVLTRQLGRLGGTAWELARLDSAALPDGLALPVSELNRLRRQLVETLDARAAVRPAWTILPAAAAVQSGTGVSPVSPQPASTLPPEIIPFVRLLPQLDAALAAGATTIYCEFENPADYARAVAQVRQHAAAAAPVEIWVAPPRIFKEGEGALLDAIARCGADGWLVRNHAQLAHPAPLRRRGDFALNIANPAAARWFIERHALERLTASYDLNAAQLDALLRGAPPAWFEVTLHQRMPLFHMEHCVFCAFLTRGRDFRDCGRPCEKHTVRLRDRHGVEHPLLADAACRNTLHNGRAQTGAEFAADLLAHGVRHFRVEFVDEPPAAVAHILARYAALLRGELDGSALWRELRLENRLGVTRGTLATVR